MKILKVALTAALVAVAAPSYAKSGKEYCPVIGLLAKTVMEARQAGVSMGRAMEIAGSGGGNALDKLTEKLVIRAYDSPRYRSSSVKQRAITDFSNDAQLECYKIYR